MRKVFDELHHHGKKVYKHARKHHKKYAWGAAGFFGLFKLFSFLIISVFSYTTIIKADVQSAITIAIPATTIDIQGNANIIQFDLHNVEIGEYEDIVDMRIAIDIQTDKNEIDMDTLRSTTATSIGKTDSKQMIKVDLLKTDEGLRSLKQEHLSSIKQQLKSGNDIAYLFPQQKIDTQDNTTIMMELDIITSNETEPSEIEITEKTGSDIAIIETGENIPGGIYSGEGDNETGRQETIQNGILQNTTNEQSREDTYCGQYNKKSECEDIQECKRDKKQKICSLEDTVYIDEKYEVNVINSIVPPILTDITITSQKTKQKINGYLKIHKNTQIETDISDNLITLQSPSLVTAYELLGTNDKDGIPDNFVHIETVEVGDPLNHITTTGSSGFIVNIEIVNISMIPGTLLHIYTSQEGTTREKLDNTCRIDDQNTCEFITPHLTLFAVGTITRNNKEFITQDFWIETPTTAQITDALFGTGGTTSAYTTHRLATCRPTSLVTRNAGTRAATNLTRNTIYVLNPGTYIQNGSITMSGCTAMIGKEEVTIIKNFSGSNTYLFKGAVSASSMILDNLHMNGSGNIGEGILFGQHSSITMNDVQTYKFFGTGGGGTNGAGIHLMETQEVLINNSQSYSNNQFGIKIDDAGARHIINNVQIFNNTGGGIWLEGSREGASTINNSQIYNNGSYGIWAEYQSGLSINNSMIYNNASRGIYLSNSPYVYIHQLKVFNNTTSQFYPINNSSGTYFGNNIVYPTPNMTNFSTGNYNSSLGWTTGSVSSTNLGFSCDFVTNPVYTASTWSYLLTTGSNCNNTGNIPSRNPTPITKYLYGNNMLSGKNVLRQIRPVLFSGSRILSEIAYHGHRFIGEYGNPSSATLGEDINIPVIIYTGTTPPQGYNIIDSGHFTIQSFIYEPNLAYLSWTDPQYTDDTLTYTLYDDDLAFMANLDKVEEIGETSTLIRDLSLSHNYAETKGTTISRTGGGMREGAYDLGGGSLGGWIEFPKINNLGFTTGYTLAVWIYPQTIANRRIVFTRGSGSIDDIEAYIRTSDFAVVHNRNGTINSGTFLGIPNPALNTWTHLVITFSGTSAGSGDLKIYHDGTYITGGQLALPLNTNSKWMLGKTYHTTFGTTSQFDGLMDEPRIYNRPLSSGEIYNLYMSNLSAKNDHREYTITYTGVDDWLYGTHIYGFADSITDRYAMATVNNSGYVVKYPNCTGSLIGWNNDNFITSGFWNSNPGHCDIVLALYGTGTSGTDRTAYTSNRTGRAGQCNYQNMYIVYLSGGGNIIPTTISANTIYVVYSGEYPKYNPINMNTCSAIIGTTGTISIYGYGPTMLGSNVIVSNKTHNILDNIKINNNLAPISYLGAIYLQSGENATINNIEIQNSQTGIQIGNTTYDYNNIYIHQSKIFANQNPFNISNASNIILSGLQIFGNIGNGMNLTTTNTVITNTQIYSNTGAGIYIFNANDHITINNLQIFNNNYGIRTNNASINKDYITVNNSQIYNNKGDGILLYDTHYFTINNSHLYNNTNNGLYFASTNNNSGILNNIFSYNNGNDGILSNDGIHKRYGRLTMFDNGNANIETINGSITAGLASTYNYLGRTGGTTDTTQCMSCSRMTNPREPGPSYKRFIDTTTYPKCNTQGQDMTRTGGIENLGYNYGINITGQKLPVYRSGTKILTGTTSVGYSGSQYVAEINKIGTYTNTTCTCVGHTYTWNNENFITGGFWNGSPDHCDIIGALYGTSTTGADSTAYTEYRSGSRAGQCNTENMNIIYLTGGTDKLTSTLTENTVYVLASGEYIQRATSNMNSCTAIIGTGTHSMLTGKNNFGGTNPRILGAAYVTYTILDNLSLYSATNHGILYDNSHSNAANNIHIQSSSRGISIGSTEYTQITHTDISSGSIGIFMESSENNIIDHVHVYNNNSYGIYVGITNLYNMFNNIQSYNNNIGVYVYAARYNTFNNMQIYNNQSDGIYLAGTNNRHNIINNSQIYNNNDNGIDINRGSVTGTILHNIMTYNNGGYGLSIDADATETRYYSDIRVFGNSGGNLGGTITNLITGSSSDYPGFGRDTGSINETGIMSRDYITNPITTAQNYLLAWTGIFTGLIGQQTNYLYTTTQGYSYGSGIKRQIQPVLYSGTTLKTGMNFDGDTFIGSNIKNISGDIQGIASSSSTSGLTVTGTAFSNPLVSSYSIFGDIEAFKIGQNIDTSTGIILMTGLSINRIITQLYDSTDYFAIHFQRDTTYNTNIFIEKTANATEYRYGDYITYTINFGNTGTTTVTGIKIIDIIMSGLTYIGYTYTGPSGMSFGSGINSLGLVELMWSGFDLQMGETGQIILTVQVTESIQTIYDCLGGQMVEGSTIGMIVNGVIMSGNTIVRYACTTGEYLDTVDFRTTKTVTGDYYSGGVVTYTINYGNSGADVGTATLIETLGPGLSGIDYAGIRTTSGTDFVITGIILEPGMTDVVVLTAMIVTGTYNITLDNTVTITGEYYDVNTGNNSGYVGFIPINANPNIYINKISDRSSYVLDSYITYTIEFYNQDNEPLYNLEITDTLITGLQYISHTIQGVSASYFSTGINSTGDTMLYRTGIDINAGQTGSIVLTAAIQEEFQNAGLTQSGRARSFDGTNDAIKLSNISDIPELMSFPNGLTVSFWAKTDTNQGVWISRRGSTNGFGMTNTYRYIGSGTARKFISNGVLTDNQRHQYMAILSGSTRTSYRDNSQVATTGNVVATFNAPTNDLLSLGMDNRSYSSFSKQEMYDVRIYNKALTSTERSSIYNHEIYTTGLVLRYKADEGQGTNIYDSRNEYHAKTVGGLIHTSNNSGYSFQNRLGRTDGNGANGADTGVYIPRNEKDITYDILGNILQYDGSIEYLTSALQNTINVSYRGLRTGQTTIYDEFYQTITDIWITKGQSPIYVDQFDTINYTLNVFNRGTTVVENIDISDALIPGLELIDWNIIEGLGSYTFSSFVDSSGNNVLHREGITLNPGEGGEILINAQVIGEFDNPGPTQSGRAYNFNDTTSSYIGITDHTDFTLGNKYTISAWINPDNISDQYKGIIGTNNGEGFIFALYNNSNNELSFWNGSDGWHYAGRAISEDGSWKHVAFTCSGTTGYFYINGMTTGATICSGITDGGTLHIGGGGTSRAGNNFDGKIYDVRIYNRGLSEQEITGLYNHEILNTGLVSRYKMDEGAGSKVYDARGNHEGIGYNISHTTGDMYSFQNILGWTDGNGVNGAAIGVYIPRNEKNTLLDMETNLLQYNGDTGTGIINTVTATTEVTEYTTGNNSDTVENNFTSNASRVTTCGTINPETIQKIMESEDGKYFYIAGTYYEYFNCFGLYIDNGEYPNDRINAYIAKVDENLSGVRITNIKSDNTNVYVDSTTQIATTQTCNITRGDGTNGSNTNSNYAFNIINDMIESDSEIYLATSSKSVRTWIEDSQNTQLIGNSVCANYPRAGHITIKIDKNNGNYLDSFSFIERGGYTCRAYRSKFIPPASISNFSPDKGISTWTEGGTGYYAGFIAYFVDSNNVVRSHSVSGYSCSLGVETYALYSPLEDNLLSDKVTINLGNTYRPNDIQKTDDVVRGIYYINGYNNGGTQGARLEKRTSTGALIDQNTITSGNNTNYTYNPFLFESMVIDNSGYIYIEGYNDRYIATGDFGVAFNKNLGRSFIMKVNPSTLTAEWIKYTQQRDFGISDMHYNSVLNVIELIGQFSGDDANIFGLQLSNTGNANYYVAIEPNGNVFNLQKLQQFDDYDTDSTMELKSFNVGGKSYIGGEFTLSNYIADRKIESKGEEDIIIAEVLASASFKINNGSTITYITGVQITNNIVGLLGKTVIKMKFCNDPSYPATCTWQDYDEQFDRYLTTGAGLKTVYAQYQIQDDETLTISITQASSSINLISPEMLYFTGTTPESGAIVSENNFRPQLGISGVENIDIFTYTVNGTTYPYYDSGLIVMMNFDKITALNETDGLIKDLSQYQHNGSGYGNILWISNGRWNGAYSFDGIDDYIQTDSPISLGNTFSVGIWIYPSSTGAHTKIIETRYDSGWSLGLNTGGNTYEWTVHNQSITGGTIKINTRQYISASYDGTKGYLYVDGILVASGTLSSPGSTSYPVYIGKHYSEAINYRSGYIDELRIYNRVVSNGDIVQMWRSNLSKYDTDQWLFTDDRQCVADGEYSYTGYVTNMSGIIDITGRWNAVSITGYTPYAPEGYFIGSTGVSNLQVTLTGQFTGYFKLEDWKGTTGRYTTIQLPLYMSGASALNNIISNDGSNIKFMATQVETLSGTNTGDTVYIYTGIHTYIGSTGAFHYIQKGYEQSYSCSAGIYGNKPSISIDIPAFQNPDIYSGMITIDFNN